MYTTQNIKPSQFPEQLREIPQPPKQLRFVGILPPQDARFLCVVGSRRYTPYGKEACEKIIGDLAGSNIIIISGLAIGIDAVAHNAALNAGLITIAFPGSGLSSKVLYPRSNFNLAKKILESGGALISEFDDGVRAAPYTFPQRNRLMAGLSHGILVIEASERSGTLITARLATEYNKDVFAIPGPIFSRNATGPNRLLRMGAIPTTSGGDILEHWGINQDTVFAENQKTQLEQCSREEKELLNHLSLPMSYDKLCEQASLPIEQLNILLSTLEIKGLIKETLGEIRATF